MDDQSPNPQVEALEPAAVQQKILPLGAVPWSEAWWLRLTGWIGVAIAAIQLLDLMSIATFILYPPLELAIAALGWPRLCAFALLIAVTVGLLRQSTRLLAGRQIVKSNLHKLLFIYMGLAVLIELLDLWADTRWQRDLNIFWWMFRTARTLANKATLPLLMLAVTSRIQFARPYVYAEVVESGDQTQE